MLLADILLHGLLVGILVSAPMGPIGILCIRRTLIRGRWPAFYTGIGAAFSDFTYCLLVGLGLSFVTDFIETHQAQLQIFGSVVLLIYAAYLFTSNPARSLRPGSLRRMPPWRDCLTGFLFTFSNPLILFLIIGLFARFNFAGPEYLWWHHLVGYIAIITGAIGWWAFVTWAVDKMRSHFNMRSLWLINRILAAIIFIMGLVGLFTGGQSIPKA